MSVAETVRNLQVEQEIEVETRDNSTVTGTVTEIVGKTGHNTYFEVNFDGEDEEYNLAIRLDDDVVYLNRMEGVLEGEVFSIRIQD